ncbi:uncharacterized protein LOC133200479 [Saccostrea echinata]|uniref:uncharacterized protein LOC133200479 n=1 Tax=Saccostrea echinata TaxID=191078 RepID=UPI002A825E55|nr:uncharacterized protein LOC133200479 [Saccostrea echinata]
MLYTKSKEDCLRYKESKKKTKTKKKRKVDKTVDSEVSAEEAALKKKKKDTLKENNSDKATSSTSQDNHYLPKRGICVDKCCYIVAENPENFTVPRGYVKFVEGHDIYIDAKWMANIKSLFRGKTKPHCLKLVMNGFYEPKELQKKTAMILLQTPLGQALKAFAITALGMDNTDIVKAINTKIGTMCRAVKENRLSK